MPKNSGAISVKEKITRFLKPISPPQSELILVSKKHEATRSITTSPSGWDACPSQGSPPLAFRQASLTIHQYLFTLLGGERNGESKVLWPSRVSNPDLWTRSPVHWPLCHCVLHIYITDQKKTHPLPTLLYTAFGSSLLMGFGGNSDSKRTNSIIGKLTFN